MPNVARWVDDARKRWGRAHVNECIRRGVAGEPGWFYASEAGFHQGTPWTGAMLDAVALDVLRLGIAMAARYVVVMKPGVEAAPAAVPSSPPPVAQPYEPRRDPTAAWIMDDIAAARKARDQAAEAS